jgi:hypothetical protein
MHQPLVPTPYAVMCRGKRIGYTDLTYTRWDESVRAGWFYPDSDADAAEGVDPDSAEHLELRCLDGSVVPTESIGIQDTERLIALARDHIDGWDPEADAEELAEDECETDDSPWSPEMEEDDWPEFDIPEWMDDEEVEWPRYQILLRLAIPNAIP